MSKSQVNALLHVMRGFHKDLLAEYPAMRKSFLLDFRRLALICQDRGLGFFTLDLPHLDSLLLSGLECGRLSLSGPLSRAVSKRVKVPRLFAGLWLRIFDKDACLRHEVDTTALAYLRALCGLGKKLEVGCSTDRIEAVGKAYHGIESRLRIPSFDWELDELGPECGFTPARGEERDSRNGVTLFSSLGVDRCGSDTVIYLHDRSSCRLHRALLSHECEFLEEDHQVTGRSCDNHHRRVHLVQAVDGLAENIGVNLPLFCGFVTPSFSQRDDQELLTKIQRVADLVVSSFDLLDPVTFSGDKEREAKGVGFRHGRGAVADRKKNWEKSQFTSWSAKLESSFPYALCGKTAGDIGDRPPFIEVASQLSAVPKTRKGPRLIAAESAPQQWCQQLLLRFFFEQCRRTFGTSFIAFDDQSLSADMVSQASLDRSLATVDLSDASDRLSCWTVERMFRSNSSLLHALHAARTRYLRDGVSKDPSFLKLRKFASQGTATTFPVMSLSILFIALGSCLDDDVSWDSIWKLRNQVRVFGDDIIVPTRGYSRLVRALELLELKVNVSKSYTDGHFRESCGSEAFMGDDVTPVRPKTLVADSPASCQAVVDTTNNLFNKGYWHASTYCEDLLPPHIRRGLRIVGRNEAGNQGLTSHCGSDESHLKSRWNPSLHRYEVKAWSVSSKVDKRPREGYSALLDFFASKHNPWNPRIVSNYASIRKSKSGLLWEPSSSYHILHDVDWCQRRLAGSLGSF